MPAAPVLRCAERTLELSAPLVMGVLNVTPDSFSDGGRHATTAAAVAHGLRLAGEGAAIIDVGGESTRPGADPVDAAEELRRVVPVIERLRAATDAVISIDTSKPEVMQAALAAGAGMVNDIRALGEPGALEAVARSGCAVCLMHMQGTPRTMQAAPQYADVVGEVRAFLAGRVQACVAAGIGPERLAVDPGFGFGKTVAHNLALLRGLSTLAADGRPVLTGFSRKSMLAALTGRGLGERLAGSLALAVVAVLNGALIVRTHDVGPTVDAVKVAWATRGERS